MKILFPTMQARPYYEKNVLNKALVWGDSPIGPHASTLRNTYTCPVNRRACITSVSFSYMRVTAPGTPGVVWMGAQLSTLTGTGFIAQMSDEKINVYGSTNVNFPCEIWIAQNQALAFFTYDFSIGGTGTYRIFATIMEFDI